MDFIKIKTGTIEKDKLQCVFLIIHCKDAIPYKKYLPEKDKNIVKNIPVVLMINRHDGFMGFPGGKVDKGEDLLTGLQREILEEINYKIDLSKIKPLSTYSDIKANIHSFVYEVDYKEIKNITISITKSEHFGIEITGFILPHLYNYKNKGGIQEFLKNNFKATAKLELQDFLNIK